MKADTFAKRFTWIAVTLAVAATCLFAFQLAAGDNIADPSNQFSRIFLAGWLASLATALLYRLIASRPRLVVITLSITNWILTAVLVYAAASALWVRG